MKILFILIIINFTLCAQEENYNFSVLKNENGLPSNTIFSVAQDSIGYIWIGTDAGLVKYDGIRFTEYNFSPLDSSSISSNYIQSIFVDKSSTLWIGTRKGLNQYLKENDSFLRYVHNPEDLTSIPDNDIWKIKDDSKNNLWLCTRRKGLIKFDIIRKRFQHFLFDESDSNSISDNRITDVVEDNKENIWAFTVPKSRLTLNKFNEEQNKFSRITFAQFDGAKTGINIKDDLWLGTFGEGIMKFNTNTNILSRLGITNGLVVPVIYYGSDHKFYIGTREKGLFIYDPLLKTYCNIGKVNSNLPGLTHNTVWTISEDNQANVWLGTFGGGINKFNLNERMFNSISLNSYSNNLSIEDVDDVFIDANNNIWILTFGHGIFKISSNKKNHTIAHLNSSNSALVGDMLRSITQAQDGTIWIGGINGLYKIDSGSDKLILTEYYNNRTKDINYLFLDSQNKLWVGQHTFLSCLDLGSGEENNFEIDEEENALVNTHILVINEDKENKLWIGTPQGISVLDYSRTVFTNYTALDANPLIRSDYINDIAVDDENNIWIGTLGGGLSKFNQQNNSVQFYSIENGLCDNRVVGIHPHKNKIWITTKNGISVLNKETDRFINYYKEDGLSTDEFNQGCIFTKDNTMIIGGEKGINVFNPDKIHWNRGNNNLILTNFSVLKKNINFGIPIYELTRIELEPDENFFTFEFSLMEFKNPAKAKYQYKLQGIDADWVDGGNSGTASYTDISYGEYEFFVKARNSNNIEAENQIAVAVILKPPYYHTWWFRGLLLTLFLAILYSIYLFRLSEIRKIQRLRDKIHKNLHDEVGSTLTSIGLFARSLEAATNENKYISNIISSSEDAREKIKDIIWIVNPDNDSIEFLISKMTRFASDLFETKNIKYAIKSSNLPEGFEIKMEIRQNIWLIYRETITNIIKHSKADQVKILFDFQNKHLIIQITENGIGFDIDQVKKGNGLINIQKRIEEINAKIYFAGDRQNGTTFKFEIPL